MSRRGLKTMRQEKTHYKMYKAKHGWLVAGITMLTISGVGFVSANEVHASTGDQDAVATSQLKTQDGTDSADRVTEQDADDSKQATTNAGADASNVAASTAKQTPATADAGVTDANAQTEKQAEVTDATESKEQETGQTADAASAQLQQPDNHAEPAKTTQADQSADTSNTTARVIRVDAISAAPEPAKAAPTSSKAQVALSFDAQQTSTSDEYLDGNATNGTPAVHVLHVSVANLQKNDVLTLKFPQFKTVSDAPNIAGMTKNLDSSAKTLSYTATSSGAMQAEFDVRFASLGMAAGTYNDSVTASVNGVETANAAMDAKYTVSAVKHSVSVTLSTLIANAVLKYVQMGATFVSKIELSDSGDKVLKSPMAWTAAKVTVPVPADYVLNQELTAHYDAVLGGVQNAWIITQAGPGMDLEMTANLDAYTDNQTFQRDIYFAGAINVPKYTDASANAEVSYTAKNVFGDFNATGSRFSIVAEWNRSEAYQESSATMYVGTTDVGVLNVNPSRMNVVNLGDMADDMTVKVEVPAGTHSNGLTIMLPKYATLTNTTAQLKALDAAGNVLDQTTVTPATVDVENQTT